MMLRDALIRVMQDYAAATKQPFAKHPVAQFLRDEVPAALRDAAPGFDTLMLQGSAGAGNWADGPWAAVFDPLITDTVQEGYYPVYLFTRTLDAVCLSMNQGVTNLKNEIGVKAAREVLKSRAGIMRARLGRDLPDRFSGTPIDLESAKAGSNLELYEAGHAFGIRYAREALPTQAELASDLQRMVQIYALLRNRGGYDELYTDAVADPKSAAAPAENLEEARRRRLHERIERNRKLAREAKTIHGYVCQVCDFNFERHYGELGRAYIIAHHKTPLAKLGASGPVLLSPEKDFAVVCANCHGMIHSPGAPATFDAFVTFYAARHPKL
jgi:5-methylcytosine-specific restriction protein A